MTAFFLDRTENTTSRFYIFETCLEEWGKIDNELNQIFLQLQVGFSIFKYKQPHFTIIYLCKFTSRRQQHHTLIGSCQAVFLF